MARTKILYLVTKSNFGGVQRYVYELATALPKEKFDVCVAFGGTGEKGAPHGALKRLLDEKNIRSITLPFLMRDISLVDEFRALLTIVRMLKKERPDVLHVNSSKAGGLGALAGRFARVPRIIFTAHGWPHQEERPFYWKVLAYLASWLTVLLSHHTIVVSKRDMKNAPAFGARMRNSYIPNGIHPFEVLPRNEARHAIEVAAEKTIPQDVPWIGAVAELTRNKGLDLAISGLASNPSAVLVLIGSGEDRGKLALLAHELGVHDRVYFAGFIEDARKLLSAFDVYIMPSRKEGLPYGLLEARHAKIPIVASDVGGIPEVMEYSEGILLSNNTSSELAEAIRTIISKSPHRTKAPSSTTEKFSFKTMLESTVTVYVPDTRISG